MKKQDNPCHRKMHRLVLPDSLLTITRHKLQTQIATTHAEIRTGALPVVEGYKALLQQLFDNIPENALKFQKPSNKPVVMINAGDCSGNALTNMYALPDTHYKWISFEDNCTKKNHLRSPCRWAYTLLNTSALLQEDLSYGFVTGIEDIDASILSNSDIR